jgi:hypothetical protein
MSKETKSLTAVWIAVVLLVMGAAAYAMPEALSNGRSPALLAGSTGTAFTFQGKLTENGTEADGAFDFQFILYDVVSGGSQVGSTEIVNDLPVAGGLFTAALDFGNVFDGTALWLEIGVRPGASGGAYSILSPRQPLSGAPYALGLAPGVTIAGDSSQAMLTLENDGGVGLRIVNADAHGVRVVSAGDAGLRVDYADDNGVAIVESRLNGLNVLDAGENGLQVGNADNHGVHIVAAGEDAISIESAGRHGIHVTDVNSHGVVIDHAGGAGIVVCSAGSETTCIPPTLSNGLFVGNVEVNGVFIADAGFRGVWVDHADEDGVHVGTVGGRGMRVLNSGHHGFQVHQAGVTGFYANNAAEDGIDVRGDDLAGFFGGDVQITGSCNGCELATFAVNVSEETLAPGDLVAIQGMRSSGNDSVPALMEVVKAVEGQAVVGVVAGLAEIREQDEPRPTEIGLRLIPRDGAAKPGEYLAIIYSGPIQIRASELGGAISPGLRLTVASDGLARPLQTVEVDGVMLSESAPVIGIALSEPDENGLVWVLLSPQ